LLAGMMAVHLSRRLIYRRPSPMLRMAAPAKRPESHLSEIRHALTHRPSFAGSDRRSAMLLVAVFVMIFAMLGLVFYIFTSQVGHTPSLPITLTAPTMGVGNASFQVSHVRGGPYPSASVRVSLIVNGFAASPVSLPLNNSSSKASIGPNDYRIFWADGDGDGAVTMGDRFRVSGDGTPLPSLSTCSFRLIGSDGTLLGSISWATSSE